MKTVKEISSLTGISPRTLHYYDEIGLLRPTAKTEAGYRLYDDTALEALQQILFFREFDIPLRQIKALMESPTLDKNQILSMQRKMLLAKRERLDSLIASIDKILEGENPMDFTIFNRAELEALCQTTLDHLPDNMRQQLIQEFGSLENWKQHYLERTSQPDYQKECQKLVDWYGSKEQALEFLKNPPSQETAAAFAQQAAAIEGQLWELRDMPTQSPEIRKLVKEYGQMIRQLYQISDETGLMRQVISSFRHPLVIAQTDKKYGDGASGFFADAMETVYRS